MFLPRFEFFDDGVGRNFDKILYQKSTSGPGGGGGGSGGLCLPIRLSGTYAPIDVVRFLLGK